MENTREWLSDQKKWANLYKTMRATPGNIELNYR